MFKLLYKYRNKYTAALLLPYLFLVGLSILHYHNVDIQIGNYKLVNQTNDGTTNPLDPREDLTHECTIMQFATTVLNFNFSSVLSFIKNSGVENISFTTETNYTYVTHFNSNPHRAPPAFI